MAPLAPARRPGLGRVPGLVVGAAVLVAVGAAAFVRDPAVVPPTGAPERARNLRFQDLTDGAVRVLEAETGGRVAELAPETGHFVRATLRALVRERRREEAQGDPAFRLAAWPAGRLTLDDPATGRSVELAAFGPANAEAFGRLLTAEVRRP